MIQMGIPDLKMEDGRSKCYIYEHGSFKEIDKETRYKKEKILLNGEKVNFKNGRWVKVDP